MSDQTTQQTPDAEQLAQLRSQVDRDGEQLATAEAQRDEARTQLTITTNRMRAERRLGQAGVVDLETASMLLSERIDMAEDLDDDALADGTEKLLLDKPLLRAGAELPPKTASPRPTVTTAAGRLAGAAERACRSGNRKDVAEYLRLRRQAATT